MDAKGFATQLMTTVKGIKEGGSEAISCDNLIAHLQEFISTPSADNTLERIEHFKAQLQITVEQEKSRHVADLEMFRSVIQSGQNAVKTSLLMNSGAAVALLAFIGKLTEQRQVHIPLFAGALAVFVGGVFSIVVASGFTYLSQWTYTGSTRWSWRTGTVFNIISIVLGLCSYGLFIWGAVKGYSAFMSFTQ